MEIQTARMIERGQKIPGPIWKLVAGVSPLLLGVAPAFTFVTFGQELA